MHSVTAALTLPTLALVLAACVSTPVQAPTDTAAAQQDQLAARNDQLAASQASKYDPNARRTRGRCPGGGGREADADIGICWTSEVNPTADHLKKAERYHARAEQERAESERLRAAEAQACVGVSELDRTMSPFSHPEDVEAVAPLRGSGSSPRLEGAVITFRAVAGMSADRLEKLVSCHLARNACLENSAKDTAYCPLVLKNVKASVTPTPDGLFSVAVRSDDPSVAQEILNRSQALTVR